MGSCRRGVRGPQMGCRLGADETQIFSSPRASRTRHARSRRGPQMTQMTQTPATPSRPLPGTRLLRWARDWFDPATVSGVFEPLVADWQQEWTGAASVSRIRTIRMWAAGAGAFWWTFGRCAMRELRVAPPARGFTRGAAIFAAAVFLPVLGVVALGQWRIGRRQCPDAKPAARPGPGDGAGPVDLAAHDRGRRATRPDVPAPRFARHQVACRAGRGRGRGARGGGRAPWRTGDRALHLQRCVPPARI